MMLKKLGPQVILSSSMAIKFASQANIVKAIDNTDSLRAAKPGAITIFRHYFSPLEQDRADPDFAFSSINGALGDFRPTYVELNNEWRQRLRERLASHAQFTFECVKRFHAVGQKVAGFSFSTGVPEEEDWLYLQAWEDGDGAKHPFCDVDALSLHQYFSKNGFTQWNGLRHRLVHQWLGGRHPLLLITETGIDDV